MLFGGDKYLRFVLVMDSGIGMDFVEIGMGGGEGIGGGRGKERGSQWFIS